MADAAIPLPPPSSVDRNVDAETVVRGGNTFYRERDTYVVAAYPQRDPLSSSALGAGSSDDLDGSTIAAMHTGKLCAVSVASSVACKWEIKTRDGGIELTMAVIFTGGLMGGCATAMWTPPDKHFCSLQGNGIDENFRVTVTNLDGDNAADAYATIFWDEVPS